MKNKKRKRGICNECIYLQKDGEDWICGCGRGFVEPYTPACREFER